MPLAMAGSAKTCSATPARKKAFSSRSRTTSCRDRNQAPGRQDAVGDGLQRQDLSCRSRSEKGLFEQIKNCFM
jgi:hypothetical protein